MAEYSFLANKTSLPLMKIDLEDDKDPIVFEGTHEIDTALKIIKDRQDEEESTN